MGKRVTFSIGLAILAFAVVWMLLPNVLWDGARAAHFNVIVLDSNSGNPVANAMVLCVRQDELDSMSNRKSQFSRVTDNAGRARIVGIFGAGGTSNGFWREGTVGYSNHWIITEAAGYEPRKIAVADFTGIQRSIRDKEFDVKVILKPQVVAPISSSATAPV